jgi:hypothetical protein
MVQPWYCLGPTISNSWAFSCLSVLRQCRGNKHYSIGRPLNSECTENLITICYTILRHAWCSLCTVWAQQYQTVEHFHVWVFCASIDVPTLQHRKPRMHRQRHTYLLHHTQACMVQPWYCLGPTISNSWAFSCLSVLRQYRGTKHYSIGRPLTPECTKNLIPVCYTIIRHAWSSLCTVWAQQYQTVEHFHVWVFCASIEAPNTTA